jgi:signal transduction histidine kinase/phage shock protein PspC (stress-responsive transcriptional regulator)
MHPRPRTCDDRSVAASDTAPSPGDEAPPVRKLYRSTDSRMLGGVAGGLAAHLGLPVLWVRMAFVALVFGDGLGALLYAAFWFVVPLGMSSDAAGVRAQPYGPGMVAADERFPRHFRRFRTALQETLRGEPAQEPGPSAAGVRRPLVSTDQRGPLLALVALVAGVLVLLNTLHLRVDPYLWPLLVTGLGVALVWRQADDSRWSRWLSLGTTRRSSAALRVVAGVILVAAGILGFLLLQGSLKDFAQVAEAMLAVLAGVLVLAGPYLLRMWQDLSTERRERIRAQERAEVAAHVHDSVLHTLTLIQRNADDPKEVVRLARAQERELREWLYRPDAGADDTPATLAESVRGVAAEVEDAHGVPVEVVCVGDCPMDDRLGAQLQAAREAMVNAAKYGGGGPVSVYAEVEDRTVWIFVRDRGPGFDLESVPEDRMGVRESIIGRMKRNGGTARVRPAPDGGTEVELQMERAGE